MKGRDRSKLLIYYSTGFLLRRQIYDFLIYFSEQFHSEENEFAYRSPPFLGVSNN